MYYSRKYLVWVDYIYKKNNNNKLSIDSVHESMDFVSDNVQYRVMITMCRIVHFPKKFYRADYNNILQQYVRLLTIRIFVEMKNNTRLSTILSQSSTHRIGKQSAELIKQTRVTRIIKIFRFVVIRSNTADSAVFNIISRRSFVRNRRRI